MTRLRDRFDSGPLSYRASVALALGVVGIVVAYLIGTHQQRTRQLPRMASATVTTVDHAVSIDRRQAQHIADVMNGLPHLPHREMHCPATAPGYAVHFVSTAGRHLDATFGVCDVVDVSSSSDDWGWDRWDGDGAARAAIDAAIAGR